MKLLLCIALHLYAGPVEAGTPVTVLSEECKAVTLEKARKAIERCAKQGAERCEVLVPPDKSRIVIERKLSTVHE